MTRRMAVNVDCHTQSVALFQGGTASDVTLNAPIAVGTEWPHGHRPSSFEDFIALTGLK